MTALTVDDLEVEVRDSQRRTTLQLTVDRGGELIVFAPVGCDRATLQQFVKEKRSWIYRKLAEKEALQHQVPVKNYVSGEGFLYLGRSYRLLLVDEQAVPVKLEQGRFKMLRSATVDGRDHMVAWYSAHAQLWLSERTDRFASRMGLTATRVVVRDLGYRWGSCGKDGTVYFHWKSVLLPPRVVEYVIAHETAHLVEPLHSASFWLRVERAMPDFTARKLWLAENGSITQAI
jgi:predicted metal-dependent hydrolase